MPNVLVLANETIGGAKLLDAVRERAGRGDDVGPRHPRASQPLEAADAVEFAAA